MRSMQPFGVSSITRFATVCIELMVMGGKEDNTLEALIRPLLQGGDGLQIQVVGGLVQQQHIGAGQHHAREHAAHLFTAGEDLHRLVDGSSPEKSIRPKKPRR